MLALNQMRIQWAMHESFLSCTCCYKSPRSLKIEDHLTFFQLKFNWIGNSFHEPTVVISEMEYFCYLYHSRGHTIHYFKQYVMYAKSGI